MAGELKASQIGTGLADSQLSSGTKLTGLGAKKLAVAAAADRRTTTGMFATKYTVAGGTLSAGSRIHVKAFGRGAIAGNVGDTFALGLYFDNALMGVETAAFDCGASDPWYIDGEILVVDATHVTSVVSILFGVSGAGTMKQVWGNAIETVIGNVSGDRDIQVQVSVVGANGDAIDLNGLIVDVVP